jgi:hypothetical protein
MVFEAELSILVVDIFSFGNLEVDKTAPRHQYLSRSCLSPKQQGDLIWEKF